MCTFDAPIARCEAMNEMVLLDETRRECALEHGCPPGRPNAGAEPTTNARKPQWRTGRSRGIFDVWCTMSCESILCITDPKKFITTF